MSPVFDEFGVKPASQRIELPFVEVANSRKQRQVVRPLEHVHRVDLQKIGSLKNVENADWFLIGKPQSIECNRLRFKVRKANRCVHKLNSKPEQNP